MKPCQNEGTAKCRDTCFDFSLYLCMYCACNGCGKQQCGESNQGMGFICAGGKGGETVPASKRPAAASAFFISRRRRTNLRRPAAGAPKPCGLPKTKSSSGVSSNSSESVEQSTTFQILGQFRNSLRSCVQTDAQKFFLLLYILRDLHCC